MTVSHKNRVQMSVSGTPGTGTITLGSAASGYQSFSAAHGANATVDVLITDGTAWEVARGCTYTHSGTTLSRGTLEASSTGSAISLTSAAVVSQIATADSGRRWDAAALSDVAGTDADTTMVCNTLYGVDMSAWSTANRTYTLPATASVGDRIGIAITAGDASHELLITAGSGDTLNGVAGGTEWSRLFITGEVVIMRCVAASATWVVEHDGRIPQKALLRLSTAVTTNSATTWTVPTAASGAWTADVDIGGMAGVSTSRITARRAGNYAVSAGGITNSTYTSTGEFAVGVWKNGTSGGGGSLICNQSVPAVTSLYGSVVFVNQSIPLAADDYVIHHFYTSEANRGLFSAAAPRVNSSFALVELLA